MFILAAALGLPRGAQAVAAHDCYQFGSGGWDLEYWGDPHVRLPPGGTIPICNTGFGGVLFRWRQPQGVFLIPSQQCPGAFTGPFNGTFQELAPVSDSNTAGFLWTPPSDPGKTYWLTSQAPGACASGVKVRVDVVAATSGATAAWQRSTWAAALAAGLAAAGLAAAD